MRRQFVSNVAFYSTTAVLILIIVLCIGATVKSESRDETQRMENRIQEQQLMSDMKQYLNENGYRNSGVTLTYALEEDGSPDYTFTIHHKKINSMSETERGALSAELARACNAVGSLIAESDLKDLGVHTEMYVDAFVDIARAGKINGSKKNIDRFRQVYGFGAGTKKMYDYLDENPELMSAPVSYTNDIRSIAALDNFISINNCVDIDLFGQISSESSGIKQISGAGGQLDFVLGAYLSNGGKSFICCSSTFTDKQGVMHSRIRPTLAEGSIVTDTRANTHYVVTEYGMVNLKGLSSWQKAEALISVAHPDFRDELIAEAEKMHIWRRSNK